MIIYHYSIKFLLKFLLQSRLHKDGSRNILVLVKSRKLQHYFGRFFGSSCGILLKIPLLMYFHVTSCEKTDFSLSEHKFLIFAIPKLSKSYFHRL